MNSNDEVSAGDILMGIASKPEISKDDSQHAAGDGIASKPASSVEVDAKLANILNPFSKPGKERKSSSTSSTSSNTFKEHSSKRHPLRRYFDDYTYDMSRKHMGHALIINNENFTIGMNKRSGTKKDGENLIEIFHKLGFEIHYLFDADHRRISEKVIELSKETDHSDNNCFVMAILSHGEKDYIYATDVEMEIKDIVDRFRSDRCPSLLGKPKIFLFQACRGNEHEIGLSTDDTDTTDGDSIVEEIHGDRIIYVNQGMSPTIPSGADFIFCYSVAEGFYSRRDTLNGSWYIQDFTNAMKEFVLKQDPDKEMEFVELLTIVNRMVSQRGVERSHSINSIGKKQMPCFHSLLTKKLYLRPKY